MEEAKTDGTELRSLIRGVIEEFVHAEQVKAEPAYKAELLDERKRREDLEKRVNDLVQENHPQPANGGRGGAELVDSRGATTVGCSESGSGVSRGEGRRSAARRRPTDRARAVRGKFLYATI